MHNKIGKFSKEGITLFESTGQFKYEEAFPLQIEVYDDELIIGVCACGVDNEKEKHWSIRGMVVHPLYRDMNLAGVLLSACVGYSRRLGALKLSFTHITDTPQDERYYRRLSVHYRHIANFQKDEKEYNIWQADLTKLEWKNTNVDDLDYNNTLKYREYWKDKEKEGPYYEEGKKVKIIDKETKEVIQTTQFKKTELVAKYEAVKSKFEK